RGDKYRLTHIRETLESGMELYISDKNFLHDLVKTHLKDRIYHARIVSTPDVAKRFCEECGSEISSDDKFCTDCGTSMESSTPSTVDVPEPEATQEVESEKQETSGGFTFTDDGDIGESTTRKSAREKPKPKKKSRKQELEEYEKKYLNESETKVSWKAYDVKAKRKVEIQNPKVIKMKNGKWAIKGTSPITGIKVFRIVGMKKPDLSGKKTTDSPKAEKEVVSRYYKSHEDNDPKPKQSKSKKPNQFCEECGSKIAKDDMFCISCGAKR
nr:zinc ribbon domain-containing protein [SAR324 cluster bacterium]